MSTHHFNTDITTMRDDQILKRCMQNPIRIPMLDMTHLVDLREQGFVICGQEMENCIAIHAHDGDRIIEGTPTLFAWVVITPKGREYLHSQGYMVPDEYGTVKVPRYRELPGSDGKPSQFKNIAPRPMTYDPADGIALTNRAHEPGELERVVSGLFKRPIGVVNGEDLDD